jgi:hypothetical protein
MLELPGVSSAEVDTAGIMKVCKIWMTYSPQSQIGMGVLVLLSTVKIYSSMLLLLDFYHISSIRQLL